MKGGRVSYTCSQRRQEPKKAKIFMFHSASTQRNVSLHVLVALASEIPSVNYKVVVELINNVLVVQQLSTKHVGQDASIVMQIYSEKLPLQNKKSSASPDAALLIALTSLADLVEHDVLTASSSVPSKKFGPCPYRSR